MSAADNALAVMQRIAQTNAEFAATASPGNTVRVGQSMLATQATDLQDASSAVAALIAERDQLHALINNPLTEDFLHAVRVEVGHQIQRWGTVHDRAKEPADWFWLVGYLAGKLLASHIAGDSHKALHHTISTAAVLANWHAHIRLSNGGQFTPGASDLQRFLEETFGAEAFATDGAAA